MPWNQTTSRVTGFEVTAQVWNDELVENFEYLEEVAYVEYTAEVAISATSEATANAVVSAGAIVYEPVPHLIEFFSPYFANQSDVQMIAVLFDGTTPLCELVRVRTVATGGTLRSAQHAVRRLTPSAGSHTYNVKAWTASGAAVVGAGNPGAGAAGTPAPGFIRIVRVPTA